MRIALKDDKSQTPADLDVEVDRGHATYAFPLPSASAEEFVPDSYKGWGEAQNEGPNPAYVELAATPSAPVTVGRLGFVSQVKS